MWKIHHCEKKWKLMNKQVYVNHQMNLDMNDEANDKDENIT